MLHVLLFVVLLSRSLWDNGYNTWCIKRSTEPILSTATKTRPVSAEECIVSISTISCNYYIIIAKFNSERKQSIYSHYDILFTRFIISRSNNITFHIINCRQLLSDVYKEIRQVQGVCRRSPRIILKCISSFYVAVDVFLFFLRRTDFRWLRHYRLSFSPAISSTA